MWAWAYLCVPASVCLCACEGVCVWLCVCVYSGHFLHVSGYNVVPLGGGFGEAQGGAMVAAAGATVSPLEAAEERMPAGGARVLGWWPQDSMCQVFSFWGGLVLQSGGWWQWREEHSCSSMVGWLGSP